MVSYSTMIFSISWALYVRSVIVTRESLASAFVGVVRFPVIVSLFLAEWVGPSSPIWGNLPSLSRSHPPCLCEWPFTNFFQTFFDTLGRSYDTPYTNIHAEQCHLPANVSLITSCDSFTYVFPFRSLNAPELVFCPCLSHYFGDHVLESCILDGYCHSFIWSLHYTHGGAFGFHSFFG